MNSKEFGIASYEEMKERTVTIARGEYRIAPDEPKVWFIFMPHVRYRRPFMSDIQP
jgi:hypothetical protein